MLIVRRNLADDGLHMTDAFVLCSVDVANYVVITRVLSVDVAQGGTSPISVSIILHL